MSSTLRKGTVVVATACASLALTFSAASGNSTPKHRFHPSAVKGQAVEIEISAPPDAPKMTFKLQHSEQMVDTEPPFRFAVSTKDLRPAKRYTWHSDASGVGCCDGQSNGGAIQIYPLPRIRAPKVSALVVAGTAHVVGLVVSRVGPNRVVRAWSFPRNTETGLRSLPLRLRQKHSAKRVYRFANGISVDVGRRTEVDVEVAPRKRVFRHGIELRGRLVRLWLTRNHRSGAVRAHRSGTIACTTAEVRKESFPGRLSCTFAPPKPAVSILCIKTLACSPGTPAEAARPARDQG